ncbi:lytic murein transglycosylase, partial [Burkholderia sp. KCJ3K979]|uniref:lytic murein transglycosylase n=1 Tax=Burkholderia sp. KCJ3K979 TaxID=2759149 RepID=UPI001F4559DF
NRAAAPLKPAADAKLLDTSALSVDEAVDQVLQWYRALGLKNFYVLTRYNRSFFYALTVYQLGEAVKAQMEASGALQPAADDAQPQ